jgi:shikimate O-hydroxycinnamoyltransferase
MKTIPLSPIDHVFTGVGSYPIEFVFVYKDTIDSARLRSSLDETLEQFLPLQSKLVKISEHSYGFQLADGGLSFEVTNSSETLEDSEDFSKFLDSVHSIEGEPLTKIKLAQTPRGSVLGVSISHALVDGFSYFHFLSSWSRAFQGKRFLNPSHRRELLIPKASDCQKPITSDDILDQCGIFWDEKRKTFSREQIHEERLLISKDTMNELFAEAQKESQVPLFDNDVITAFLWKKCITKWNAGNNNPITYISCPFDYRRVLRELPRTYFGCAVCVVTASIDYESLVQAPLGKLALLIRKAVGRVKRDYILGSLETLERLRQQKGLATMEEIHVMHPRDGLLVTNISRLPVHNLEFGSGPPMGFQVLSSAQRGAVILPAQDGLDIRVYHPVGSRGIPRLPG